MRRHLDDRKTRLGQLARHRRRGEQLAEDVDPPDRVDDAVVREAAGDGTRIRAGEVIGLPAALLEIEWDVNGEGLKIAADVGADVVQPAGDHAVLRSDN